MRQRHRWCGIASGSLIIGLVVGCGGVASPSTLPLTATASDLRGPTAIATGAASPTAARSLPAVTPVAATSPVGCDPAQVTAFIERFLAAYNMGDQATLRNSFPTAVVGRGNRDFAGEKFEVFSLLDRGPDGTKRFFVTYDLPALWAYFAARHAQHETLGLVYPRVSQENVNTVTMAITLSRTADDLPAALAGTPVLGKGGVNCRDQHLTFLNLGQGMPDTPTPAYPVGATPVPATPGP